MQGSSKRVCPSERRAPRKVDFKLSFTSPQTVRKLFDLVSELFQDLSVEVIDTDSFKGISIANIDEKKVCVVQARLECDVELAPGADCYFTISVATLCTCMRTVAAHYLMDITKYYGSEDVEIDSRDQITGCKVNSCRLSTLCKDFSKAALNTMKYDYTIQIELSAFRSIVKVSKDLHAETIGFEIRKGTGEGEITFCLRAEGDAMHEHYFPSTAKDDDNTFVTSTEESHPEVDVKSQPLIYEDHFSVNYLNTFLKSMERQILTLRIACNESAEEGGGGGGDADGVRRGSPLVLMYPLGPEQSYVCFVLAPKQSGD